MKYKDYKRLSKISLKSRKKTTRSTVRGISFGLILLLPLLFIVIAFHIDLNKEVDKDASIRVFNIGFSKEFKSDGSYISTMLENYSEQVYEIKGIENVIKYNQYSFNNKISFYDDNIQATNYRSPFEITIGDKKITLDYNLKDVDTENYSENNVGIYVVDKSVGNSIFIKADSEVIGTKNPIVAGNEFSTNSSKEIMISSSLLSQYNLTSEDVINKNITITYELQEGQDITTSKTSITGTDSLNYYKTIPVNILKDYKIVGVFDADIYKSQVRADTQYEYYNEFNTFETYFWITSESLYNVNNHSYIPEYLSVEVDNGDGYFYNRNAYYYSDTPLNLANNAKNNNSVFIPLGMGVKQNQVGNTIPTYNALIEFESYKDANNAVSIINSLYEQGAVGVEDPSVSTSYMNDTFNNYRMFYNVFTYVCIVLAIFGGVVFFATLLNLYNTIHYSVQSRRNYLGMIRAIGMKSADVIKMYFVEIFQIFKRSYVWSAIFGGGICIGLSFAFDAIMNSSVGNIITIDLSLNPIFILVAFGILIIVNTIISIAFALVACHNVSNKPILEVLVENR